MQINVRYTNRKIIFLEEYNLFGWLVSEELLLNWEFGSNFFIYKNSCHRCTSKPVLEVKVLRLSLPLSLF